MRHLPFAAVLLACSTSAADLPDSARASADTAARSDTVAAAGAVARDSASSAATPAQPVTQELPIIRGLYVNRFAAQSMRRMRRLIDIADSTEINAFVIDVKDEFGLNIASSDPMLQKNAGTAGVIPNARALLDTLKAHDILAIARIVVFKDSVAARVNPEHVMRKPDGSPWRDKQGLTWVNPYDETIWE